MATLLLPLVEPGVGLLSTLRSRTRSPRSQCRCRPTHTHYTLWSVHLFMFVMSLRTNDSICILCPSAPPPLWAGALVAWPCCVWRMPSISAKLFLATLFPTGCEVGLFLGPVAAGGGGEPRTHQNTKMCKHCFGGVGRASSPMGMGGLPAAHRTLRGTREQAREGRRLRTAVQTHTPRPTDV